MKKIVFAVLALALVFGCSKFEKESALFVGYNVSGDPIEILVNNGTGFHLGPNGSGRFTVEILVPAKRVNDYGGPSSVDKVVDVSVAVRNLRSGNLVPPQMCQAGAKMVTHVTYENRNGYDYISCRHSYPY